MRGCFEVMTVSCLVCSVLLGTKKINWTHLTGSRSECIVSNANLLTNRIFFSGIFIGIKFLEKSIKIRLLINVQTVH